MEPLSVKEVEAIRAGAETNWGELSCSRVLSEDFMREFHDKVDWTAVSERQTLSEDFIREFQDKVDWRGVSWGQTVSEDFIREFQDKVVWCTVSWGQILSEDFIREFQKELGDTSFRLTPVTYDEIMSYNPCPDGVERYLKHTTKEEAITWNQLVERHPNKADVSWLSDFKLKGMNKCK